MADDDYLKPILDLAAAVGTKGVTSAMRWPEQIANTVQSNVDAAKFPGDVVTGRVDPMSDEGIKRAVDLAGSMMLGGAGAEAPAGSLRMFAGRNAKTADLAKLATAEKMATEGAERRAIWDATGWFQGADGKWRFEVPDHEAEVRGYITPGAEYEGQLSGILKHRNAYMAYDDLPGIEARYGNIGKSLGSYSPPILADESIAISNKAKDPLSSVLHETQHAIQQREGFARGASGLGGLRPDTPAWDIYQEGIQRTLRHPSLEQYARSAGYDNPEIARRDWKDYLQTLYKYKKSGLPPMIDKMLQQDAVASAYRRAAGEVEARNVQSRMAMTPEERAARPPWETQDIPDDQQIVQHRASGGHVPLRLPLNSDDPNDVMRRAITYAFAISRMYKADGGSALLQDEHPSEYLSHVGRQVMQDGGAPNYSAPITGQHTITLDDLIGRAPGPASQMGAYTDAGGQRISAPFVTSTAGGYPVYSPQTQPEKASNPYDVSGLLGRIFGKGRQGYATQGGVPEVEDALRVAREAQDREAMSHPVGMSGKVEFAPVRLREPLSGYEIPLGSIPKESAPAANAMLDTAERFAPYAFGPLAGSAYDMAVGAKEGSMADVATGALGLPGKAAKAAGILGSTLIGGDAEAGPISKLVQNAIKRSTELREIAGLPREEAIAIARKQPHLIPAGDQSEGFYVGGPRDVMSKRGLTNRRNAFDAYVGADTRGSDWYDRYRNAVTEVTGADPQSMDWMTKTHGMMSAGVDPGSETQFALRETNGQIAGMPVKAARPAQHEALQAAINALDPSHIMLGDKTGEYARLIHPDQTHIGATGVNDFRHARNWGYTEASGDDQRDALTAAQHRFLDYETALAVDRANKAILGGKSDWTGEQLQAAPWVRQKALAIAEKRKMPYEDAFQEANKTIADFFPKHTAYATHEALPGPSTGHLPSLPTAPQEIRDAYSADPRSLWNNAPGGRDAIYSGLGVKGTGVNMRVRPSIDMQGAYQPEGMEMQFNRGQTARPLVAFDTSGPAKTVAPADKTILDAGELVRAYIDAQDAGAWHKPFFDAPAKHSNSYFIPMERKSTPEELRRLIDVSGQHGLGDVVDTGEGVTVTNFADLPTFDRSARKAVEEALALSRPEGAELPQRAFVDSGYAGLTDEWKQGLGSGAATRAVLATVNKNPQLRAAFENNPHIPSNALARMERDADYAAQYGATREDIQNARRIIGEGPGWVSRLEQALKNGVILPALGAALFAPALLKPDASAGSGG